MAPSQTAKKKILIVDDESSVRTYLQALLEDNGYETASACNGKEGIEKVRQETPDLVTLDISMPEESGVRFYRDLREDAALAKTPVVIVTAVTGPGGNPEGFKKFISSRKQVPAPEGFISKPIDREEFLKAVAGALA
jgi:CheY-like chemotaxis protein